MGRGPVGFRCGGAAPVLPRPDMERGESFT